MSTQAIKKHTYEKQTPYTLTLAGDVTDQEFAAASTGQQVVVDHITFSGDADNVNLIIQDEDFTSYAEFLIGTGEVLVQDLGDIRMTVSKAGQFTVGGLTGEGAIYIEWHYEGAKHPDNLGGWW